MHGGGAEGGAANPKNALHLQLPVEGERAKACKRGVDPPNWSEKKVFAGNSPKRETGTRVGDATPVEGSPPEYATTLHRRIITLVDARG